MYNILNDANTLLYRGLNFTYKSLFLKQQTLHQAASDEDDEHDEVVIDIAVAFENPAGVTALELELELEATSYSFWYEGAASEVLSNMDTFQ